MIQGHGVDELHLLSDVKRRINSGKKPPPKKNQLAVTHVSTIIATFLSFVYQFTPSEWIIESNIWPEKE